MSFAIGRLCIIIFLSERGKLEIGICHLITLKTAYAHAFLFAYDYQPSTEFTTSQICLQQRKTG